MTPVCVCWTLRSICKEDPGNLNAWANLGYVYDKLGRETDTAECVDKVSHLMGLDGGEASQEETRLLAARCLAEQAYVYPYDVELESQDDLRERLTAALSLYNRALDYGGQLVSEAGRHKAGLSVTHSWTLVSEVCAFYKLTW